MGGVRARQSKIALCIPVCSYGSFSTSAILFRSLQQHAHPAGCPEAWEGLG